MTDDMVNLRSLVEKSADADLLRDTIGFAGEKLMALEVAATGAAMARRAHFVLPSAMATAIPIGRRKLARLNCVSQSCGLAAISQPSWNASHGPKKP
jgi:hypothetical protein